VTVYDLLPGTPEVQTRKLALLATIRKLVRDPALDVLTPDERKKIDSVGPAHPLTSADARGAAGVGAAGVHRSGRHGGARGAGLSGRARPLGVEWPRSLRIARVLQVLHLDDEHKTIDTSGSAVVFAAMIRSVLHDGPRATGAALLAVLLLVLLIMRPLSSAGTAIATLLLGVIWMLGVAGLFGVRITFLNFIALPITFGIGAEYGLNVAVRYRQDRDMIRAVISTGTAVAVCSWTTIVGYGSLLAAATERCKGLAPWPFWASSPASAQPSWPCLPSCCGWGGATRGVCPRIRRCPRARS